jgi:ubiquitin carboxyl-terminal hydrolase 8
MLRFSYEGRWKQKLQTTVDFPLEGLDLSQYVIAPRQNLKKYCLYGVSVSRTLHCAPTC